MENIKRYFIESAKNYASETIRGVTVNNPRRYKSFRDGQDNAYKLLEPENTSLKARIEKINRLFHDLTPGGSEFYNDPEYCAEWIRSSREENHYLLSGRIKEFKEENEKLKARIVVLENALKLVDKAITEKDTFLSESEWEQIESALNHK